MSVGDMGRLMAEEEESEETRVGEVGDMSSSDGDADRLDALSRLLNVVNSAPRVTDLRLDTEGDAGLGEDESSAW